MGRRSNCPYSLDGKQKTCSRCGTMKPLEDFFPISGQPNKVRAECKPCMKQTKANEYIRNIELRRAQNKAWRSDPKNRERRRWLVRAWHYRTRYGLTEQQKRDLEAQQDHKCAICLVPFSEINVRRIHVDHDHATGKIRGVLCHNCNQVLGQARDRIPVLEAAIAYLNHHTEEARHYRGYPVHECCPVSRLTGI